MKNKSWLTLTLPRQKLQQNGIQSLSDVELISILLGTGIKSQPILTLAKEVLKQSDGIYGLGKQSLSDLTRISGIGEAKAMSIIAALELGRRRSISPATEKVQITSSKDGFELFSFLSDLPHEEFWILLLNRNNKVIVMKRISSGGISGTVVDSRIIFKHAVENCASSVVLCHNHPSGNFKPSEADIMLTRRIKEAGKLLEIVVIDHIIVADKSYFSFADEGMI